MLSGQYKDFFYRIVVDQKNPSFFLIYNPETILKVSQMTEMEQA